MIDQEDIDFFHDYLESSTLKSLNLSTLPTLRIYHPPHQSTYEDLPVSTDFDALRLSLIHATFNPLTSPQTLNARSTLKLFQFNTPMLMLFNTSISEIEYQTLRKKIMIAKVNISDEVGVKVRGLAGVPDGADVKEVRIVDPNPGSSKVIRYRWGGEVPIVEWVEQYIRGELKPMMKTE